MPAPETSDLYQKAVLWEREGYGDDGQPTLGEPEELDVRWLKKSAQMRDKDGNLIGVDVTVRAAQEIKLGSVMVEGTLENWQDVGSGGGESELMEVVATSIVPDLKARETSYRYGLKLYKGQF